MLRVHFTAADLGRVCFAAAPDPFWELCLSMHMVSLGAPPLLAGWGTRVTDRLRQTGSDKALLRTLFTLNPPNGYFPDYLTPAEALDGFDAGLDALLRTPKQRLRAETDRLVAGNAAAAGRLGDIRAGRSSALIDLGKALRRYHDLVLAPDWPHLTAVFEADRQLRARQMVDGGVGLVLDRLARKSRFHGRTLEVQHYRSDVDVHLNGRGVVVVPSYFKEQNTLMLLADPALPPVLVYPVDPATRVLAEGRRRSLTALLGRTRAAVVEQVETGASVSEIAFRLKMGVPAASKHLAVLRGAGLVAAHRDRHAVRHRLTTLGHALLYGTDR